MSYLLSIDPGSRKSGIVVMTIERNPKLIHHEVWTPTREDCPVDIVDEIFYQHSPHITSAVIEDQYLGKNPDTTKKIVRNGGKWEGGCEYFKIGVEFVHPRTWQAAILGLSGNAKSDQIKKMYTMIARQDTGVKLTEDECAAWCMGKYTIGEMLK